MLKPMLRVQKREREKREGGERDENYSLALLTLNSFSYKP